MIELNMPPATITMLMNRDEKPFHAFGNGRCRANNRIIIVSTILLTMTGRIRGEAPDIPGRVPEDIFRHYRQLNDSDERLVYYKDSDPVLKAKLIQLCYINETRARFGAQPLKLDILASRLANRMSREAAAGKYVGHWNLDGEKPWHRYASAGGTDHVSENVAAISTTAGLDTSPEGAAVMMREMYDKFMAEKPPYDGHKSNCIDKHHNYIGIGYCTIKMEFRYYEEYIDRYIEFFGAGGGISPGEECRVSFRPLSREYHVYAVMAYHDPFPEPLTADRINRMGSYDDFTPDISLSIWPWEIGGYLNGDRYEIPMTFNDEGLYYIHIYLDDREFSGNSASTEGKLQASGVVIRVAKRHGGT